MIIGSDNATAEQLETITRFALKLGLAFQITDDTLNLSASEKVYGKEINGDIMEGKRTLILIHLLNSCTPEEMRRMRQHPQEAEGREERVRGRVRQGADAEVLQLRERQGGREGAGRGGEGDTVNECDWMTEKRWKNFFLDQTNYLIYRKK